MIKCSCNAQALTLTPDNLTPLSPIIVLYPIGSSLIINSCKLAALAALSIDSWLISFESIPRAIFDVIVSSVKKIYCGTYPIDFCQAFRL